MLVYPSGAIQLSVATCQPATPQRQEQLDATVSSQAQQVQDRSSSTDSSTHAQPPQQLQLPSQQQGTDPCSSEGTTDGQLSDSSPGDVAATGTRGAPGDVSAAVTKDIVTGKASTGPSAPALAVISVNASPNALPASSDPLAPGRAPQVRQVTAGTTDKG